MTSDTYPYLPAPYVSVPALILTLVHQDITVSQPCQRPFVPSAGNASPGTAILLKCFRHFGYTLNGLGPLDALAYKSGAITAASQHQMASMIREACVLALGTQSTRPVSR